MTKSNLFASDPIFNKEYRIRFEYYFDNRYCDREPQLTNLDSLIRDFLLGLGFTLDLGIRGLGKAQSGVDLIHSAFRYVHKAKEKHNKKIDKRESKLICALATSAFLFDFGYDDVYTYTQMEKKYVHLYKINMNKVRVYAKELYKILALRFDEFLNLVPMSPIKWSMIERAVHGTKGRKSGQNSKVSKDIWSEAFRDSQRVHEAEQHVQGSAAISVIS